MSTTTNNNTVTTILHDSFEDGSRSRDEFQYIYKVVSYEDDAKESIVVYQWRLIDTGALGEHIKNKTPTAILPVGKSFTHTRITFNKITKNVYHTAYEYNDFNTLVYKKMVCCTNSTVEDMMLRLTAHLMGDDSVKVQDRITSWEHLDNSYPVLKGIPYCGVIPSWITKHARKSDSIKQLSVKCLGSSAKPVRRVLLDILATGSVGCNFVYGNFFQMVFKRIAKDNIHLAASNMKMINEYSKTGPGTVGLFTTLADQYGVDKAVKLVITTRCGDSPYMFNELSEAAKDVPSVLTDIVWPTTKKATAINIHDMLVRESRKIGRNSYMFGEEQRKLSSLHGHKVDDLYFFIPTTSADLEDIGSAMGICVGGAGYDKAVYRGDIHLVALADNAGDFKYCIETAKDGEVRQFMGKYNTPVKKGDMADVSKAIKNSIETYTECELVESKWSTKEVIMSATSKWEEEDYEAPF